MEGFKLIFNDRLEFYDQCIAGERAQFELLLSKEVFNTFDRGYELYRDYIKQKNTITDVNCTVEDNEVIVHIKSSKSADDLVSENIPKRGILPTATDMGVDLHISLIDIMLL